MGEFEQTRSEEILTQTLRKLNGEAVSELAPPQSRMETLLQQLLDKIGSGSGGGGSGGGYVVEFNTYDNGQYSKGYVSVDDAADIIALYKAGNSIVFHFPEYPFYDRESYMSLVAYLPANESALPDYTESFITAGNVGLTYGDVFEVNNNGKLEARIYID